MGSSAEANLAYGYDLGSMDEFKAEQVGEYGAPQLPWFDADDDGDPEDGDFTDAAEKRLLAAAGFTEIDWRADGFYERERAAKAAIGVEFEFSGSGDYPGWVLVAGGSKRSVEWAETMTLDLEQMRTAPAADGWDGKLAAALATLGITPTQPGPRWLVFPYYG